MFLDPEPRRPQTSGSSRSSSIRSFSTGTSSTTRHDHHHDDHHGSTYRRAAGGDMSPGFFASNRPIASPRDSHSAAAAAGRRRPLHERSQSQNNRQPLPLDSAAKPTVRLVTRSPSPQQQQQLQRTRAPQKIAETARGHGSSRGADEAEQDRAESKAESAWRQRASVALPETLDSDGDYDVSDSPPTTNEARAITATSPSPSTSLLSDSISAAYAYSSPLDFSPPWLLSRRDSSGEHSLSSTLHDTATDLNVPSSRKSYKSARSSDFSQLSTLRGTPTPTEQDLRDRLADAAESTSRFTPTVHLLETLPETSPDRPPRRSTIRRVPPSDTSSSSDVASLDAFRPRTPYFDWDHDPRLQRKASRRTLSTGSIQSRSGALDHPRHRDSSSSSGMQNPARPNSLAISDDASLPPPPSSPNFIAYSPDSTLSQSQPRRGATPAEESINSRAPYGSSVRPTTGRSLTESSSWASLRSGGNPVAPLHVSKKRLRHKAASASLKSQAGLSGDDSVVDEVEEDVDYLPYPKRSFSRNLSTIPSESDRLSKDASQQLSSFSIGSGVWTEDDPSILPSSSYPLEIRQPSRIPAETFAPSRPLTRQASSNDSGEGPGDMTLGIFREESAIPQPLFKQAAELSAPRSLPIRAGKEDEEDFDTLTDLQGPPLRQKRSGYSMRRGSSSSGSRNDTAPPSSHTRQHSQTSQQHSETDRFSQGSTIFPTWAKHFYTGAVVLSTKPSIGSLASTTRPPALHGRTQSSCTDRSAASRPRTGHSLAETAAAVPSSPASSRFLPSIFRPRTRTRPDSRQRDSRSRPAPSRNSQDSMAIRPILIPGNSGGGGSNGAEILPSGQPRWGPLKTEDGSSAQPLPNEYHTHRHWDQMDFPRPMTTAASRTPDFVIPPIPHLNPSRRYTQQQQHDLLHSPTWRPPSFVSSLDTLLPSRHNRQILLFVAGFPCPLFWFLAAFLPLPPRPDLESDPETAAAAAAAAADENMNNGAERGGGKEGEKAEVEDVHRALRIHQAAVSARADADRRWRADRSFHRARWWRAVNRVMSGLGVLVLAAVIALAVVATR